MILYRIRRIEDGKCFAGWVAPWNPRYRGTARWYDKGQFFGRIDTVVKHLELLSSDWEPAGPGWRTMKRWKVTKEHRDRLKLYEVVVNDVTLMGEKILKPKDLIKKKTGA